MAKNSFENFRFELLIAEPHVGLDELREKVAKTKDTQHSEQVAKSAEKEMDPAKQVLSENAAVNLLKLITSDRFYKHAPDQDEVNGDVTTKYFKQNAHQVVLAIQQNAEGNLLKVDGYDFEHRAHLRIGLEEKTPQVVKESFGSNFEETPDAVKLNKILKLVK